MAALSFPAGIRPYRAGDTGYAQYMTAFNRNFGGSSGGGGSGDGSGCGCLIAIAVVVVLVLIAMGS
ncbi:MAG: HFLK protein [Clostridiales bacterium 52_15]|nr:MAG: HFLK protein [Clostridiales bacterium 52_15]